MKYILKTKIENGIEKIDYVSNVYDRRKSVYLVMGEDKKVFEVDKDWVLKNIDNIINVGVSGTSLFVKSRKDDKTGVEKVEVSKENRVVLKHLSSEIYEMIELELSGILKQKLPGLFRNRNLPDVKVTVIEKPDKESVSGNCILKLEAVENTFKFDTGFLALEVLNYLRVSDNGYKNVLGFRLLNGYMNNIFKKKSELIHLDTYNLDESMKKIDLKGYKYDILKGFDEVKFAKQYGKPVYVSSFKGDKVYVDGAEAQKSLNRVIQCVSDYVRENRDIFIKYLYAPKDYVDRTSLYVETDKENGIYLPLGIHSVQKVFDLENKGYRIVVDDVEMKASEFRKKCQRETSGEINHKSLGYKNVFEYVDEQNKVFYVKLGEVILRNMKLM